MVRGVGCKLFIRHPEVNSLNDYVAVSEIPIINAGNGWREKGAEHPTQALLDLYTIKKELGFLEDRKILLIGDMNARVIRSFVKACGQFSGIKLYLLSPEQHWISPQDEEEYRNRKIYYQRIHTLDDILEEVDVIYQNSVSEKRTDTVPENIRLTQNKLQKIKDEAIVLHSFPRSGEMANDVDNLPQAKYFIQARNAVPVRMALLTWIFGHEIDQAKFE
ncbi:MAG: hypothetical protein VKL59_04065 [Nostocaceae cyanobacterium]|nr:hypothetical protein [Nostocaceae cyanobacterium]